MKKLFWMAGLMMLAACNNQEMPTGGLPEVETGRTVVAKATLPGGESRLALTEVDGKTIKVDWKESGETFSVMTGTSVGDPVTFTQTTGNEFTGTLPDDWTGPYYAFYPERVKDEEGNYLSSILTDYFVDPVTTVSVEKVPFDLLLTQTGKLEDISPLMMAVSQDGENYAFQHLTAIVKLTLNGMETVKGQPVLTIVLQGPNTFGYYNLKTKEMTLLDEELEGELGAQIDFSPGDLEVSEDGSVSVYLCLPPVSKETPLLAGVVVVDEGEEQYHEYLNTNVALTKDLEAGKYYRVEREVKTMEELYNFTVDSPEGLMEFAKASNENNMGFPMQLTLTDDIDMSGQTWTPINQNNASIPMNIDGGGHTISNLTVNGEKDEYCGFIASLNYGSIVQNLHFENISVTGAFSGGIVGYLEQDAQIVGCSVSGQVTGSDYAAGIVSYNATGVIGCCLNAATVTVTNSSSTYSGGISALNGGEILGCINTGNVTGGNWCGAIVGYNQTNGEVSDCYWSGAMAAGIGNNNNTALESDATAKVEVWTGFEFSDLNSLLEEIDSEFVVDTGTNLPKLQKISSDPGI